MALSSFTKKLMKPFKKGKEQEGKHQAEKMMPNYQHQTSDTLVSQQADSECSKSENDFDHVSLIPHDASLPMSRLAQVVNRRRWQVHESILDVIGQTPIVQLQRMAPSGVNVYVKCENTNPGGSLKDRLAAGIIEWAEMKGNLKRGQTVVEASSGNTGVGMAMVCAVKGYPFVCVMSEAFSIERRKLMRFLGARVILTKKEYKSTGMVMKAKELADKHGFFYAQQFENEANAWMHEQTTGPEIVQAFVKEQKPLDHFFMSYGSGGTVLGVGRAFRKAQVSTKVYVCEPSNAAMLQSGIRTNYPKSGNPSTAFDVAHPVWSPHLLQGWATDFIPKLAEQARKENHIHKMHSVGSGDAIHTSRQLAAKEGIFTGISGGGILAAALKFAKTCPKGTTVLAVLPDTGERYMSTSLFDNIPTEMTKEEKELSSSTPSVPPPAPPSMHGVLPVNTDQLFDM